MTKKEKIALSFKFTKDITRYRFKSFASDNLSKKQPVIAKFKDSYYKINYSKKHKIFFIVAVLLFFCFSKPLASIDIAIDDKLNYLIDDRSLQVLFSIIFVFILSVIYAFFAIFVYEFFSLLFFASIEEIHNFENDEIDSILKKDRICNYEITADNRDSTDIK